MQSLVVSLLAVSALAAPTANPIKVSLPQRRSLSTRDTVDYATVLTNLNHTVQKYTKGQSSLKTYTDNGSLISSVVGGLGLKKRQNAEEALADQVEDGEDELYYGPGTVGGKSGFTFDFDTGSADTFVPGPTCGTAQGCTGTVNYENTGTDEGNTTTVTYGSGEVSGENYYDTVTIAGLKATHQNIISLTTATGFSDSDSNSLMGMGFQSIAASGQPPYFKTLIDEGVVTTPEFSFFLGRAADGTGQDSEMTLGGRDTAHFTGTPTTIAVSTPGYWQIPLDGIKVNDFEDPVDQAVDKGQAAIDTGTTIVLAPSAALLTIAARIPGAFPVPLELVDGEAEPIFLAYPCASDPSVALTFGGVDFAIDPRDFDLGQLTPDFGTILGNNTLSSLLNEGAYCLAAVAGFDIDPTENLYVVGDTFLKNWYSIYSYDGPSVSFAKSQA